MAGTVFLTHLQYDFTAAWAGSQPVNGRAMKNTHFAPVIALLWVFLVSACDSSDVQQQGTAGETGRVADSATPVMPEKQEIDWFSGGIREAFALAREQNMPLFLYWGAVWCPPCVEIKENVFKSQQFIAQSKLFIPVYLDGDTRRAQVYGDKFDAKVYPTMIVFNPDGEEVTRLHAGIDISAYNTVLELSLDNMRSTRALVEVAQKNPESLTDSEVQQLAYYSWNDGQALPEGLSAQLFNTLSTMTAGSNPQASSRFYLQYVHTLAAALKNDNVDAPERADPEKLKAILDSPDLVIACWDYLIAPEALTPAIGGEDDEIAALQNEWAEALRINRRNERLSTKNQLYGWRPYLVFHFQGDAEKSRPLPEDVIAAIRADGAAADERVTGSHERESVINTVSNVYVLAGLADDARKLLKTEIGLSATPYYFMGSLAELEEREGNLSEALEWRRKGYETSEGPATRIRWWASYVQALTRMAPEDSRQILDTAQYIFDPSSGMGDYFSGANFRNLDRANTSLWQWNRENHGVQSMLDPYTANLQGLCRQQAPGSVEYDKCESLLQPAAS
jgi:thiol-disulfide isomerase/thioredoxin